MPGIGIWRNAEEKQELCAAIRIVDGGRRCGGPKLSEGGIEFVHYSVICVCGSGSGGQGKGNCSDSEIEGQGSFLSMRCNCDTYGFQCQAA